MKICIICPNIKKKRDNTRMQPGRYVYELGKSLVKNKHDIFLIINKNAAAFGDIKTRRIRRTKDVLDILEKEKPDAVIKFLGLTSFLRPNLKINQPVIGILTSPIYSLREALKMGAGEFLRNFNHALVHLVGALVPKFLIKWRANNFKYLVVLSKENKRRLEYLGISNTKILTIPPGINEFYLKLPNKDRVEKLERRINPKKLPIIMYFTSPLTLRGTDTLVNAFAKVRKSLPCKLVFLSRREHKELIKEERFLKKIAQKKDVFDSVEFVSKYLRPKELKEYLSVAEIICLPFKVVISDVPVSLLEAMALGKPVISTNVSCSPELLKGRGLVVEPNNPKELAKAVLKLLRDKKLAKRFGNNGIKYMKAYPRWGDSGKNLIKIIQRVVNK